MIVEVKVPALPESVSDATIAAWHKKVGDFINQGENLVDLETDKVILEVPAPSQGVLKEILFPEGSTVQREQILALVDIAVASAAREAAPPAVQGSAETHLDETLLADTPAHLAIPLSPSARRATTEYHINPDQVTGTGKDGRITKHDVLQAAAASANTQLPIVGRFERRVPMSRLRARVAERLLESQHNTAMLTTFNEIDLHAVMSLRQQYKESFEKAHGVRLGFMSFFTKAAVEALKRFPDVNASIDGHDIVYHDYFDIGIAVSSPRGLVVPILRDADRMRFADIEKAISTAAEKAKTGKLTVEEMTGGTFTITNGGVFGSLLSTPILNPPQSAILGMHKIEDRAVVVEGQIVIRPMMYVALSYDHRIIDGKESVSFLVTIKNLLEDPARLLLDL